MLIEAREYLAELIAVKRAEPDGSVLSQLVAAEAEGDKLTMDELLSTTVTFLVAGHETTTSLLGNGVLTLMQHPRPMGCDDGRPGARPQGRRGDPAVREPGLRQPRLLRRDAELGGRRLKEGDVAFQMLGGANRDPAVFDRPDTFDIRREPNRHIAFGLGPHFCIGAPLSRAEGQIAFSTLTKRMPNLELDGTARWDLDKPNSRVLRELPVRW